MASNPNNAIGTNAAYGGRTSVNAFNDDLAAFSRGVLSGWGCTPNTGLTVSVGGDGNNRDVAIAEDNIGDRTTINNISGSPVNVTLAAAPGANSRIDAIVAYVDNPPQGSSTVAGNPSACGIIAVSGTAASSPVAPTESAIRSAITADGASGTTAYFVVLAYVTMASGTTDIVTDNITAGPAAQVSSNHIDFATLGDQTSYIELGDIVIQWGVANDSSVAVVLPVAMADTSYSLTLTPSYAETSDFLWWAHAFSKLADRFSYRAGYKSLTGTSGGKAPNTSVSWVVIGKKAN